jgi:hypothetical protein
MPKLQLILDARNARRGGFEVQKAVDDIKLKASTLPGAFNVSQFNREITTDLKRCTIDATRAFQKRLGVKAITGLVTKTRVRTGRARGGWQVGIDSTTEAETGRLDPSGAATIAEGVARLQQLTTVSVRAIFGGSYSAVHFFNNVPYITFLEDGSPTNTPDKMVALTVQELISDVSVGNF